MSLSVCIIVKDEEAVIARCLNCAMKFADEIIVVDTGSADNTVEEAKKFTDEIYFFEWCDDFASARNFAFSKAGKDYVMWLDADDVITDENCEKIKSLVQTADFDMAFLPYAAAFDGEKPTFTYYRERIFKRAKNYKFSGAVHEAVAPEGKIIYSDAAVFHKKVKEGDPLRNLGIYQKMIASGERLDGRAKFYYGRELLFNNMRAEGIAVLENYLKGDGWSENKAQACLDLYDAYTAEGDTKNAIDSVLKSFLYTPPKSRACCILGGYFFEANDIYSAIYWYNTALNCKEDVKSGAFINCEFCGYIPLMQLCVIYDRLGDYQKASAYNEEAGKIKPDSREVILNRQYFAKRFNGDIV